jgi:hypothetical protein
LPPSPWNCFPGHIFIKSSAGCVKVSRIFTFPQEIVQINTCHNSKCCLFRRQRHWLTKYVLGK